jgi:hypothetical protein
MRAISSSDFAAFTSSITRRSSANDQDFRFNDVVFSFEMTADVPPR